MNTRNYDPNQTNLRKIDNEEPSNVISSNEMNSTNENKIELVETINAIPTNDMTTTNNEPPYVFPWTLDASLVKSTIFHKKNCKEVIDITKLYGFIKNEMGVSYQSVRRYGKGIGKIYNTELEHMIDYKKLYHKKSNSFQVFHKLAKHKWGRITPTNYLSLSIFHRPTRHAFCEDYYIDYDMINAHPSLIHEICKHHNLHNQYLADYVANPKHYRQVIMNHHNCDKDRAKRLPIILMFGGTYHTWVEECDITTNNTNKINHFKQIEDFMTTIIQIVYNANPQIKKDVLKQDKFKWKTEPEAKRGVMALWSQSIEKIIQEECVSYLVDKNIINIEDVVPCQDGFMMSKENHYPQLCEELNTLIKGKFNIDIGWTVKPFDEAIEIPSYSDGLAYEDWVDKLSVKCLADRFLEEFGDYVIKTKQGQVNIYYGKKQDGKVINGRWYNETDAKKRYKLYRYISEDLYSLINIEIKEAVELEEQHIHSLLKTLRDNTANSRTINDIVRHILTKAKEIEKEFDNEPFLLGFNNGVYDLMKDEFRDYTYEDYITLTTQYDYNPLDYSIEENQKMKELLRKIIDTIQPEDEHQVLYLQVLASGLDGMAYQKLFLFNGCGGNGKGFTGGMMDVVLGDYYSQPTNGILKDVEKSNAPSPDLYNLKGKRYVNFKEVSGSLRVAVIRNLTGGGKFVGRLLNCNPETFYMMATWVMEFNLKSCPDLDGKPERADYRRIVDLLFPNNFTNEPEKIGKTINGVSYVEGNDEYTTPKFINKMRDCFLDMLLSVYRNNKDKEGNKGILFSVPQSIKDRTEDFLQNQNKFLKLFNSHFILTPVELNDCNETRRDKTMKLKEMWETISQDGEYKHMPYRLKRQYSKNDFYTWCDENYTHLMEGNSKTGKLFVGVSYKETDDGNEDDETYKLYE